MVGLKGGGSAAAGQGAEPGAAASAGSAAMLQMVDRMDARPGWQRSRTRIRVVAVLCAVLAGAAVFSIFTRVRSASAPKPEPQLIASIDLTIGNPTVAFARGAARAKADIETGVLKLQTFGLAEPPSPADAAKAERLKKRYGIEWVNAGRAVTPVTQAFADGYNSVSEAEIERRHGQAVLERLKHGPDGHFLNNPGKAAQP